MRCDVTETSRHVTMKLSTCKRAALYKSGVYAVKAWRLTPGGQQGVEGTVDSEVTHGNRC